MNPLCQHGCACISHPGDLLQFTVRASDRGIPSLSDTAPVSITIRTVQDPYFQPTKYEETRPEDTTAGNSIITITAVDPVPGVRPRWPSSPPSPLVVEASVLELFTLSYLSWFL